MRRESFSTGTTLPAIVIAVTQLHLLRNVASAYYALWLFAVLLAALYVWSRWGVLRALDRRMVFRTVLLFNFPLIGACAGLIGGSYESIAGLIGGFSRCLFVLPMCLVVIVCPPSVFKRVGVVIVIFTAIAALSIPYQFLSGPIEWFAESSERAGFGRYASLFGSLTALGTVNGLGLIAAVAMLNSAVAMCVALGVILLGSILSLQKAAILNIALALPVIFLLRKFSFKQGVVLLVLLSVFAFAASVYFGDELLGYVSSIRFSSDSEYAGDVSVSESLVERVVDLPLTAILFHGVHSLLLGVGPIGGSGAFGFADVPMAHNAVVDLLLVGGLAYLVYFGYFFYIAFKLAIVGLRSVSRNGAILGLSMLIILLINMPFSSLLFFTPSGAMFFAFALRSIIGSVDKGS